MKQIMIGKDIVNHWKLYNLQYFNNLNDLVLLRHGDNQTAKRIREEYLL